MTRTIDTEDNSIVTIICDLHRLQENVMNIQFLFNYTSAMPAVTVAAQRIMKGKP